MKTQKCSPILLFIKIPPPTTGPTLMNKRVHDSELINQCFDIRSICISYMKHLDQMGKWGVSKFLKVFSVFKNLFNELWFHRPIFVYFQISPHGFGFLRDFCFVTLIKLFRVKILFHMRGKGIRYKSKFYQIFYKYCFQSGYMICLSSLLICDVKPVFSGEIFIVPNGIPDANQRLIQRAKHGPLKILFLSNLIESKGVLDFIEALSLLYKEGYDFEGVIVGAEADISETKLNDILKLKGISKKVKYLGAKYDNEKYQYYLKSDLFVFPTKSDCFPGVVLEAMQFGLPVVSTREGAIPEIIDEGVTGFLVKKNAPQQIVEKIEKLIQNPELRQKMSMAGRKKFLANYTIDKFEEKMKNVFNSILSQ